MTTAMTVTQQKVANIRGLLEKSRKQMEMALPRHMNADRLMRVAMTSIQKTPRLLECTPQSLLGAIMQAAQLGLEPDGLLGQAYLVPYKTTVTLIPGYKGLVQLARRSGELSTIMAHVVHARDRFDFQYGLEPNLVHVPSQEEDPGPVVAVYAVAKLKDGGTQFEVMWRRQVEEIRKRSKASSDGPWVTDWDEMAKKTVLRRLCKLLPASIELQTAVSLDERAEAGISQELDILDVSTVSVDEVTGEIAEPAQISQAAIKPKALDAVVEQRGKNGPAKGKAGAEPTQTKEPLVPGTTEESFLKSDDIDWN